MKIKGDSIFSTSFGGIGGGLGFNNIIAEEAVVGGLMPPITDNLSYFLNPDEDVYSDAGSTLAINDDAVYQVNDQSSNSYIFAESVASNQLTYKVDGLGAGNNSLYKDSQPEWLDFNTSLEYTNTTSFTIYSVFKRLATDTTINVIGRYNSPSSGRGRVYEYWNGVIYIQDMDGGQLTTTAVTQSTNTTFMSYVIDRVADEVKIYKNGSLESTTPFSSILYETTPNEFNNFIFERLFNHNPGESTMTGHFGYQLGYAEAHSSSQITDMWNWVNTKYGIV